MLDKSKLNSLPKQANKANNISPDEISRFDAMAKNWWDPNGKYKTALLFNQARLSYFIPQIAAHFSRDPEQSDCLRGLRILDVGSGGGLVCEPLAQAGATVVGIDASEMSIKVAQAHAMQSALQIDYRHMLSTELVAQGEQFDVVINAEVVEHVPDQAALIGECCALVAPSGMLVLATLNRTIKSFIIGIVGAEYVMRYLPIGTHSWGKFVKPDELEQMASAHHMHKVSQCGMRFNPILTRWSLSNDTSVNYMQCYRK